MTTIIVIIIKMILVIKIVLKVKMIVKVIVILIIVMIMVVKYSSQAPFYKPSHSNPTIRFWCVETVEIYCRKT